MKEELIYQILEKAYFGETPDENKEIEDLNLILPPESKLFIDVGASLGQYTKRANEIMKDGHIIAIEADPIRFKRLLQLSKEWGKNSTNTIEAINGAITSISGIIDFFITNSNISGGLYQRDDICDADNWKKIRVPGLTLDEICGRHKPDLIKIDVEGGEMNVLKGSKNLLASGTKFLLEIHQDSSEIENLFTRDGYICNCFYNHLFYQKKFA